ncbi:hypothetical protein HanIR_Chr01g0034601 [Helianthus annuus]|nr:hypothetical protein HanIR_Chr01g0034601 [Helianthus annuus]
MCLLPNDVSLANLNLSGSTLEMSYLFSTFVVASTSSTCQDPPGVVAHL